MTARFRLAKLLHYWELKESITKMEIAKLASSLARMRHERDECERLAAECLAIPAVGIDPDRLRIRQSAALGAVRAAEALGIRIEEETTLWRDRKSFLEVVIGRRQALESLKAKRQAEGKVVESRKQQKELDELWRETFPSDQKPEVSS